MYTFEDKGGRSITLRPEGTASVLRAVLEHSLHRGALPVKLWYSGSYYRYERPQKGRYRHFSQVGAEALGVEDAAIDAELVILAADAFRNLGLRKVRLLLNSLGDRECRPAYRAQLQDFLRGLDLDEETRRRVDVNPLRVLDDKRPDVRAQLAGAPLAVDYLCEACKGHHEGVRELLRGADVPFEDSPTLVRGLDYYTRTTFEFVHDGLGAQSAIGGGGRYDGLSESIGGPSLPGVGWALGVDRTVLALEAEDVAPPTTMGVQVFAVPLGEDAVRLLFGIVTRLRRAGVRADLAYGDRGLKGAMKAADRSGAGYAVVVGARDLDAGVAQVKNLATGEQTAVALDELIPHLQEQLS
jgi:histidyl-tRNA synthetase